MFAPPPLFSRFEMLTKLATLELRHVKPKRVYRLLAICERTNLSPRFNGALALRDESRVRSTQRLLSLRHFANSFC